MFSEDEVISLIYNKINNLPFPKVRIITNGGGHVLNYVFSYHTNNIMKNNSFYGHQGTPREIIDPCDTLLTQFFQGAGGCEIRNYMQSRMPDNFNLDWISLRIIFDIDGNIKSLQAVDASIVTPSEEISLDTLMHYSLDQLGYSINLR